MKQDQRHSPAAVPSGRKATARHKRHYLGMSVGVLFAAASIGAVVALSGVLQTSPSQIVDNSVSGAPANATGTIVLHPHETGCLTRTFDNRTGQILETPTPCKGETRYDANGRPIATGTMRTMDSISKSFK
jgi:hypothetical protein